MEVYGQDHGMALWPTTRRNTRHKLRKERQKTPTYVWDYIASYYITLCYIILYYIVFHYIILYCIILYYITVHCYACISMYIDIHVWMCIYIYMDIVRFKLHISNPFVVLWVSNLKPYRHRSDETLQLVKTQEILRDDHRHWKAKFGF